ncbi:MAG: hypothetical protein K6B75_00605, partial [Lachnospiraceae bacterium]|nr:hypothetical protein [Lachnospiraceae bacterium]
MNKKVVKIFITGLLVCLAFGGCGKDKEEKNPSALTPTAAPTATPTPSATPTPVPEIIKVDPLEQLSQNATYSEPGKRFNIQISIKEEGSDYSVLEKNVDCFCEENGTAAANYGSKIIYNSPTETYIESFINYIYKDRLYTDDETYGVKYYVEYSLDEATVPISSFIAFSSVVSKPENEWVVEIPYEEFLIGCGEYMDEMGLVKLEQEASSMVKSCYSGAELSEGKVRLIFNTRSELIRMEVLEKYTAKTENGTEVVIDSSVEKKIDEEYTVKDGSVVTADVIEGLESEFISYEEYTRLWTQIAVGNALTSLTLEEMIERINDVSSKEYLRKGNSYSRISEASVTIRDRNGFISSQKMVNLRKTAYYENYGVQTDAYTNARGSVLENRKALTFYGDGKHLYYCDQNTGTWIFARSDMSFTAPYSEDVIKYLERGKIIKEDSTYVHIGIDPIDFENAHRDMYGSASGLAAYMVEQLDLPEEYSDGSGVEIKSIVFVVDYHG